MPENNKESEGSKLIDFIINQCMLDAVDKNLIVWREDSAERLDLYVSGMKIVEGEQFD